MAELAYVGQELDLFAGARNWKSYVASMLQPWIRHRVLEVGAGIGATTRALWNDSVESWTCLEPDPDLSARLRQSFSSEAKQVRVVTGVLEDLSAAEMFDAILYVDVLEHIENDAAELHVAAGHLRPGGALIVLSPAFQFLYSEFDRALGHYRRYTSRSLARAFPSNLQRRAVFYADSIGAGLSLGNRLLLRQESPRRRQIEFWDRVVVPASRLVDPIGRRFFGRSVIAVFTRPAD